MKSLRFKIFYFAILFQSTAYQIFTVTAKAIYGMAQSETGKIVNKNHKSREKIAFGVSWYLDSQKGGKSKIS